MDKDKVRDYLNSLEVVSYEGGDEGCWAIVEVNEEDLTELERLGVDRNTFLAYGDEGEVCILAYACSEGIADYYDQGKLVYADTVTISREEYGELLVAKKRMDILDEMDGWGGIDSWSTTS